MPVLSWEGQVLAEMDERRITGKRILITKIIDLGWHLASMILKLLSIKTS